MHRHISRGINPETNFSTTNFNHHDPNIVANTDHFIHMPAQH